MVDVELSTRRHGQNPSPPLFDFCSVSIVKTMEAQITPRRRSRPARFPNAIREYRLRAGLTQRRLGVLIGKGRSVVSQWERGQTLPTLANAFRLARALDTLVESLYIGLYLPKRTKNQRGV